MPDDIVLIGPVRAGKSTLGKLLADRLGLPQVSLDVLRVVYYKEIGFDEVHAQNLRKSELKNECTPGTQPRRTFVFQQLPLPSYGGGAGEGVNHSKCITPIPTLRGRTVRATYLV
jgi:hypothetical protein